MSVQNGGPHSPISPGRPERPERPERVVLVGRTGLEHDLRRIPNIELGRARSALEAVGEFAEISSVADDRAALVVVGPGAVLPDHAEAFVAALRKVDPVVRVVAMGDLNGAAGAFDAVVPAVSTVEAVRRALAGEAAEPVPAPAPARPTQAKPVPAPSRAPAPAARPTAPSAPAAPIAPAVHAPTTGTPAPLAAMLSGQDPIAAATEEMSARLRAPCAFAPGEQEPPADGRACIRVAHSGRTLGWLLAGGVDSASLEREGAALAGWVLLAAQHDQLRRAAFMDELTGAFNRRYFNRYLRAAMDQARAKRHTVTLLVFDIDNFKTYNDRYSHAAGDEILCEAVRLLTSVIRPTDRVCRVGGDEFAVIFHDPEGPRNPSGAATTPRSIGQIAARFQRQICEHRFPKLLNEAPDTLTISGGMATFPWDGATPEELLARADELAMQSKRQGKNDITFGPGAARVCQIGDQGGPDSAGDASHATGGT